MTEERKHRPTPIEYAVNFNRGAVYAKHTGALIEGMELVYNGNGMERAPIIQEIVAGAKSYIDAHNEYSKKMEEWKVSEDKTEENKPKPNQNPDLALAEVNYGQLARAMDTRTKIFDDNWEQLSLKQAIGISQYRNMPKDISKTVMGLINNNDGIIKDIKNKKAKGIADAFKQYYTQGETAKDIEKMYLEKSLETLAT